MTAETENRPKATSVPQRRWTAEIRSVAGSIPNGAAFGITLILWLALFHVIGNSTLGYVRTSSLFGWMDYVYGITDDDRHGFVIPFIVIGLLWWKRAELAAVRTRTWWPALILVSFCLALHVAGLLTQQARISIVGFYLGIWGLAGAVWGPGILRATFFPACLLVFAVPLFTIADKITFPLRHLATSITARTAVHVFGIGVQQQGTGIFDPSGRYSYDVAAACSGLRSLTAIFALTTVYAFVFFQRAWKRAFIVLLAFPLALLSNVLRLLMIIIVSEAFSAHAGHVVHESTWLSLVPYVVAFAGILLAGRWIKEDRSIDIVEVAAPVVACVAAFEVPHQLYEKMLSGTLPKGTGTSIFIAAAAAACALLFLNRQSWRLTTQRGWRMGGVAVALIAVSLGALAERKATQRLSQPGVRTTNALVYAISATNKVLAGTNMVYLPESVLSYRSQPLPLTTVVYDWLPKDTTYGQRRYYSPDTNFIIENIVVLMGADRTSIHKPQYCITGQGFSILSEDHDTIPISRPMPYELPVKKLHFSGNVIGPDGRKGLVNGVFVYWFVSDRELTAEHGARMWQMGYDLIRTGVLTRWAYVICMGYCEPGREDAAYERIKQFIAASVPEYQVTVGRPAASRRDVRASLQEHAVAGKSGSGIGLNRLP